MADRRAADALLASMRLPIIAAPMFLISGPDIVIAAAHAGILGAFPTPNARTIEDLAAWLARIDRELATSGYPDRWAINMIVHQTYERFEAELDLVCAHKPAIVITALGSPVRVRDRVHAYGGQVYADVIAPEQARKAIDAGADGLILVASGAGGHTGQYSAFAFVEDVRSFWDGPLVLGGAIGSAKGVRAALDLGADFAYVGTRFIASTESLVSDENRDMLVRSKMTDIMTTQAVTGIASNWMRESLEAAGFTSESLDHTKRVDFSSLHSDRKAWKSIWGAGHSIGKTQAVQSVAEIVADFREQFRIENGAAMARGARWSSDPVHTSIRFASASTS